MIHIGAADVGVCADPSHCPKISGTIFPAVYWGAEDILQERLVFPVPQMSKTMAAVALAPGTSAGR